MWRHIQETVSRIISLRILGLLGLPWDSDGKEPACNAGDRIQSLSQEDPLEKETATHSNSPA